MESTDYFWSNQSVDFPQAVSIGPDFLSSAPENLQTTMDNTGAGLGSSASVPANSNALPGAINRNQLVEKVWVNSVKHRPRTGGELLIPFNVAELIGAKGIQTLIDRFKTLTNACVFRYDDNKYGCVRLMNKRRTQQYKFSPWAQLHINEQLEEAQCQGMNLYPDLQKIPRPPNSFILYRKHHHRTTSAENPGMTNTDISKLIADKWKNEPADVKEEFKNLANQAKLEHALKYPGYQYSPRRPGQKARRRPRIHPSALTFMWKTHQGAKIMDQAAVSTPSANGLDDGWIPVTRDLIQHLNERDIIGGEEGLGPLPYGATPQQLHDMIQRELNAPSVDASDDTDEQEEDIFECLGDDFLEDILNFDG